MSKSEIVKLLASCRAMLRGRGVEHVALFGSRARGDERAGSDVDLLIEVAPDRKFSLVDLVGVERVIGEAIGVPVGVVMRRSVSPTFLANIQPDIVEVF